MFSENVEKIDIIIDFFREKNKKQISEMENQNGYLEITIGPMFSGKTTSLIKKHDEIMERYKFSFKKDKILCVINHQLDQRYSTNMLSSHNSIMIPVLSSLTLRELWFNSTHEYFNKLREAKFILIDETQFFEDLYEVVINMLKMKKNVFLYGLDGDYNRNPFGRIYDLIPYCDKIVKMTAVCSCGKPALFSHRITQENEQILVGVNNYVSLCRGCFPEPRHPDNTV